MSIESIVPGTGGTSVSGLADLWRQQVLGGTGSVGGGFEIPSDPAVRQAQSVRGDTFGTMLTDGIGTLEGLDATAQTKAVQAATGDLQDVHDYSIAATQLQTATELTTTIRNKALEAFNDIIRMPL